MAAKMPTPEQARMFHTAMTGIPLCFHDCCLCRATDRVEELENAVENALAMMDEGNYLSAEEELRKVP